MVKIRKNNEKLEEIQELITKQSKKISLKNIGVESLRELRNSFDEIEDRRFEPYVEHLLGDIVIIVLMAIIAGENTWVGIGDFAKREVTALSKFLRLPNGSPSHDTIQRVMYSINSFELMSIAVQSLLKIINKLSETQKSLNDSKTNDELLHNDIMAIDGKVSKGSGRNSAKGVVTDMHNVSIYSTKNSLTLTSAEVVAETNETPVARDLIKIVDIEGCILTWDALHTQRETVDLVISRKGHYVAALKKNQHNFYDDVALFFHDKDILKNIIKNPFQYCETLGKEKSCIVKRQYFLTQDIDWLSNKNDWAGLKSIGIVRKTVQKPSGKVIVTERLFISSISDINVFAKAVRKHWHIENKLHRHLDCTFLDDKNTTMQKTGAKNLQNMKMVSLAILSIVQSLLPRKSLNRIRRDIVSDFENQIFNIFKLLSLETSTIKNMDKQYLISELGKFKIAKEPILEAS